MTKRIVSDNDSNLYSFLTTIVQVAATIFLPLVLDKNKSGKEVLFNNEETGEFIVFEGTGSPGASQFSLNNATTNQEVSATFASTSNGNQILLDYVVASPGQNVNVTNDFQTFGESGSIGVNIYQSPPQFSGTIGMSNFSLDSLNIPAGGISCTLENCLTINFTTTEVVITNNDSTSQIITINITFPAFDNTQISLSGTVGPAGNTLTLSYPENIIANVATDIIFSTQSTSINSFNSLERNAPKRLPLKDGSALAGTQYGPYIITSYADNAYVMDVNATNVIINKKTSTQSQQWFYQPAYYQVGAGQCFGYFITNQDNPGLYLTYNGDQDQLTLETQQKTLENQLWGFAISKDQNHAYIMPLDKITNSNEVVQISKSNYADGTEVCCHKMQTIGDEQWTFATS